MKKKKKAAKKRVVRRRMDIPRPHNGGEWTVARYRAFIKGALRNAKWPVKYRVLEDAFVRRGINPKTGRQCKLHRCAHCEELFPQTGITIDHIDPVIPIQGFDSWDKVIARMFCEKSGLQPLCKQCHRTKTEIEKEARDRSKGR